MWVIKAKGESFYVDHVTCELPWSTKETPENEHTKASIKVKRCHLVIDENNHAYLRELTKDVEQRLSTPPFCARIITSYGQSFRNALRDVNHSGIKMFGGGCGTTWYVTEFTDDQQYLMFKLTMDANAPWRELKPNEDYYQDYADRKNRIVSDDDDDDDDDGYFIDEDDYYYED